MIMMDNSNSDYISAVELIKAFKTELLDCDLKDFDFARLEGTPYGCPAYAFDCDDTQLTHALLFVIWHNRLPELKLSDIGTGKKYRGDTINTFNTLFGKDRVSTAEKWGLDEILRQKTAGFFSKYHTVGNFMLMPNRVAAVGSRKFTINQYRGVCGWHDYFDTFLIELEKCLNDALEKDASLYALCQENGFYFDHLKEKYGDAFTGFCNENYLEPYIRRDAEESVYCCSGYSNAKYPYHWKKREPSDHDKKLYAEFAQHYIDEASRIIDYRADMMIRELENNFNN